METYFRWYPNTTTTTQHQKHFLGLCHSPGFSPILYQETTISLQTPILRIIKAEKDHLDHLVQPPTHIHRIQIYPLDHLPRQLLPLFIPDSSIDSYGITLISTG